MKKKYRLFCMLAFVMVGAGYALCDDEDASVELRWSGFSSMEAGQVVAGESDWGEIGSKSSPYHVWLQKLYTGYNTQILFNSLPIVGNVGMGMKVTNEYPVYSGDKGQSRRLFYYPYLSRSDLTYSFGNSDDPSMSLTLGYFPFKYNSDARNLGEYMFRSGTYPQYLITDFDFAAARLLGFHLDGKISESFKWDILATFNTEWAAIGDLNLTGIASYQPIPFLTLGAGAGWFSLVSANWDQTTPVKNGNSYIKDGKRYYYTFAGQKVMGRFSLDPQSLFHKEIFGPEDLKIYSEAAILGVINYPESEDGKFSYDDIKKRIPVMFGLNIPAFKILDVLSLQAEWFGSDYVNDMSPVIFDNAPVALSTIHDVRSTYDVNEDHKGDDWKWSLYGKRTLKEHFQITFQFARDHMRWYRYDYTVQDGREALRSNKDWYYIMKLGYVF
jgi:hypothetical protein